MEAEAAKISEKVQNLIKELEDPDYKVRQLAAKKLVELGSSEAVEPLGRALDDSDWIVREYVAEALGKIKNPAAVEKLCKAMGDIGYNVRENAKVAFKNMGGAALKIMLENWNNKAFPLHSKTEVIDLLCPEITSIYFGNEEMNSTTVLNSPDMSNLTVSLNNLSKVIINSDYSDFKMVEQFFTYAMNYMPSEYLQKNLVICIHGNPDRINKNLRNLFDNVCAKVEYEE